MILLVTPAARGRRADSLNAATGEETHWAQNPHAASTHLRQHSYPAAVSDQFLLETEPEESEQMLEHLGPPFRSTLTSAAQGWSVLCVKSALHRRKREETSARRAIEDQMRETLTAMLLSCELAMSAPNVPAYTGEKIRAIDKRRGHLASGGKRADVECIPTSMATTIKCAESTDMEDAALPLPS